MKKLSEGEFKKRFDKKFPIDKKYGERDLEPEGFWVANEFFEWIEEAKKEFLELIPRETKDSMYMGCAPLIDSVAVYQKIVKWFGENRRV